MSAFDVKSAMKTNNWTKKTVSVLIFAMIIVVFVFWGMSKGNGPTGVGNAAVVNRATITRAELSNETQRIEQFYAQFLGSTMDLGAQRQAIQMEALRKLIDSELVTQQAEKEGWVVADGEIRDFIVQDIPVFQEEGRFQRSRYEQYLTATQSSASKFEQSLRKEKINMRAYQAFEMGVQPMSLDLAHQKSLRETEMNVAFVRLNKDSLGKGIVVTDAEITEALAKPEFMKNVEADYKQNRAQYKDEEQVKARHILIRTNASQADSMQKAQATIAQIKQRAEKEDFAKLAKEFSEDPGSKDKGGDLGFFGRGTMDPTFEKAAFSLELGKISDAVVTTFGVHLIQVEQKKAARDYSVDDKKVEIAKKLLTAEKSQAQLASLQAALKEGNEAAVNAQVKSLGGTWEETGAFRMDVDAVPKLSPSPNVQQLVFDLSTEKPFAPRLANDGLSEYVFKLKSMRQVPAPAMNEKTMLQQATREKSSDLHRQWLDTLRGQAKIDINPALMQQETE